jgi:hypothetical protein
MDMIKRINDYFKITLNDFFEKYLDSDKKGNSVTPFSSLLPAV